MRSDAAFNPALLKVFNSIIVATVAIMILISLFYHLESEATVIIQGIQFVVFCDLQ